MIKSFDVIGGGLAWSVRNGRKLRIGVDPWVVCLQQHLLMENTILALRKAGFFYLHQLAAPERLNRWDQSWIRVGDLGFDALVTRDLERYIISLIRDHIILRDREDVLIWDSAPAGNYTPKSGYIVLSCMEMDRAVFWWWKTLWKLKFPPKNKLFMWCVLENKAPTWDNLQKRSFQGLG